MTDVIIGIVVVLFLSLVYARLTLPPTSRG